MKNKKLKKGFTLVELIVVIAIVAILASVAIVGYTQFITSARSSNAENEFNQIYNVIYTDAAAVGLDGDDWHVSTDNAKITITFKSGLNNFDKSHALKELLDRYLTAGFYQGEFIFEQKKFTYNRPGGGTASRAIAVDLSSNVKIKITITSIGELVETVYVDGEVVVEEIEP